MRPLEGSWTSCLVYLFSRQQPGEMIALFPAPLCAAAQQLLFSQPFKQTLEPDRTQNDGVDVAPPTPDT
jgi:hypothetical protein